MTSQKIGSKRSAYDRERVDRAAGRITETTQKSGGEDFRARFSVRCERGFRRVFVLISSRYVGGLSVRVALQGVAEGGRRSDISPLSECFCVKKFYGRGGKSGYPVDKAVKILYNNQRQCAIVPANGGAVG